MKRFGEYEMLAPIGRGGMGEIWVARHASNTKKLVALKALTETASKKDSVVAMFMDEASIMAQIRHKNVLEILDFGRADDRYFIAMEYLQGCSLARLIVRAHELGGRLDPVLVAFIGAAAARGLHAAHTAVGKDGEHLRVVHRDVSPQNIFVTYSGATKVIDFGIARADKRLSRTSAGVYKGKAAYMSPEQVREEPLGGRSDIFALGVCLWEALTGRRLFLRPDQFDTMAAVMQAPIEPPAGDDYLNRAILEALERNVELRTPTAASMEAALTDYQRAVRPRFTERDVADALRGYFKEDFEKEVALLRDLELRTDTAEIRIRARESAPTPGQEEVPTFAGNPADLEAMEGLGAVQKKVELLAATLAPLEVRQAQEAAELRAATQETAALGGGAAKKMSVGAIALVVVIMSLLAAIIAASFLAR